MSKLIITIDANKLAEVLFIRDNTELYLDLKRRMDNPHAKYFYDQMIENKLKEARELIKIVQGCLVKAEL